MSRLALRPRTLSAILGCFLASAASADWPQWGGPNRDFHAPAPTPGVWDEGGPEERWERPLGLGYSAIAVAGGIAVTHFREGDEEIVAAFDRATGAPVWSYRYAAPFRDGMRMGYGSGPHATPTIHDGRVFAVGATGRFQALDAASGELLWQRDLWNDLGGTFLRRGYAASPLIHDGLVLATVGGEGRGVVAFEPSSGDIRWRAGDFENSQSSPIIASVDGRPQLVLFVNDEILGMNPNGGELLWRQEHKSSAAYNIATPLFDPTTSTLVVSSAYGGGSRALRLSWDEDEATATPIFYTPRVKVHYTNMVRLGAWVYGSSGNTGSIILSALGLEDGEVGWKERRIGRANLVVAGERVLALDVDGRLFLTEMAPSGLTILAEAQLGDAPTWTAPTLVGDTLFVRDETSIRAYRLPTEAP